MFRRVQEPVEPEVFQGPVHYPNGVALEDDKGGTWLIKNKKRFKFYSKRACDSWGLFVGECLWENIEHLPYGGVVGFRDGTLLSKFSDGTLHLVSDNKTRQIVDPDALFVYGLLGKEIYEISNSEFKVHEKGEPLDV